MTCKNCMHYNVCPSEHLKNNPNFLAIGCRFYLASDEYHQSIKAERLLFGLLKQNGYTESDIKTILSVIK